MGVLEARKVSTEARTPIYDTEGLARTVSHWVRTSGSSERIGADGAAAVQAAMTPPGQISTLILPADTAWTDGGEVAGPLPVPERSSVAPDTIRNVASALRKRERAVILMSGQATCDEGLVAAQRVAHASGATLKTSTQISRTTRGRGRVPVDRIPYAIERAMGVLEGIRHVVLAGAKPPTGFFGYPGKPSLLSPSDAQIHVLARPEEDAVAALNHLADELGAPANVEIPEGEIRPRLLKGPFEPIAFATTLAALLPENCIVSEDAVTSGPGAVGANLQRGAARLDQPRQRHGCGGGTRDSLETFADVFGAACGQRGPFLIQFDI